MRRHAGCKSANRHTCTSQGILFHRVSQEVELLSGFCCQGNLQLMSPLLLPLGVKKIRNPERMVRIAVGYTGHAPPKSDDTDANSKGHTNALHTCLGVRVCTRGDSGSKYKSLLAG